MKVYVFPGQGSQSPGMGKELFDSSAKARELFSQANDILGFSLSDIMFNGSAEDLKETKVTQPAVFVNSIIKFITLGINDQEGVAGHSLGEFSALVANQVLTFEDALQLVSERALAMQDATEMVDGTMAAILAMEDADVENICNSIEEVVVAANYNCPGQLVISGSRKGIELAVEKCTAAGARRAIILPVGGAFHSPLMAPAKHRLEKAIETTTFSEPTCPIYQNVIGTACSDPNEIKQHLIDQLTSPVKWTKTMQSFVNDGMTSHNEVGAKVLTGFIRKFDRSLEANIL